MGSVMINNNGQWRRVINQLIDSGDDVFWVMPFLPLFLLLLLLLMPLTTLPLLLIIIVMNSIIVMKFILVIR